MCLIVVGALAPLCFLFSVFQNARPPATPRWLGPPLTQRSKNVGQGERVRSRQNLFFLEGEFLLACRVNRVVRPPFLVKFFFFSAKILTRSA